MLISVAAVPVGGLHDRDPGERIGAPAAAPGRPRKGSSMHASIRKYKSSDVPELARRAEEGFLPLVKEVDGFRAYLIVDGGDGTTITCTFGDSSEAVAESVSKASDWVAENIAELVEGSPEVTNGEVLVQSWNQG